LSTTFLVVFFTSSASSRLLLDVAGRAVDLTLARELFVARQHAGRLFLASSTWFRSCASRVGPAARALAAKSSKRHAGAKLLRWIAMKFKGAHSPLARSEPSSPGFLHEISLNLGIPAASLFQENHQ
jgi:hypothetical protein